MVRQFLQLVPLWALGLFAALVLLIEAPLIAFPFYAGDSYQGINIAHFGNDEHHYLSRAREALEGNGLGQPFLAEGKEQSDPFQSNIEQLLMFPLRVTGLAQHIDVVGVFNVMNSAGLVLLLVLMYSLVYAMSKDALLAATCAIFAVGGYILIEYKTVLYWLLVGRELIYDNFNIFGRSMFPYAAAVPFFGFLILTYKAVTSRFEFFLHAPARSYVYLLGAGALFGFLFYVYFYAWTFALGFLGSLTLSALLWRKWHAALSAIGICAVGILIGSFRLYGLYQLYGSALGEQVSYFLLTLYSRDFIMSNTGLALAVLLCIYLYFRRSDQNNFFLGALILAGWVALEQQMITGRAVQFGHYYWYFVVPISIVVGIYIFVRLLPQERKLWGRWVCIGLIVLAFANTMAGQYRSFWTTVPGKMREQDFTPIMKKLQEMPQGVVFGDPGGESYRMLTTIYTDDDNYWSPSATQYVFAVERYKEVLLVYLYINEEARMDPVSYLTRVLKEPEFSAYGDMYEELEGFTSGVPLQTYRTPLPHEDPLILATRKTYLPEVGEAYRTLIHDPRTVRKILEDQGVRYILWDQRKYPEWDLSVLEPLTLIATSTDLVLYSLSTRE